MLQANCSAVTSTAVNSDYQPRREVQNDYVFTFETGPASKQLLVVRISSITLGKPGSSTRVEAITATASPIDPFNPQLTTASNVVSVNFNQPPAQVADTSQTLPRRMLGNRQFLQGPRDCQFWRIAQPLRVWEELVEL